jgi:hypothetical protein
VRCRRAFLPQIAGVAENNGPAERPAAASFTAVPRSLASSLSPSIAGAMATPLVLCGVLKSVYDVALLVMFRKVPPQD